jgi:iron complex outermembrane receptor protein
LFLWGPNPKLEPERIINYETGIQHSFTRAKTNFELTVFAVNGDNMIINVPLKGLLNSGKIANKGIEVAADCQRIKNLVINCAYSYISMEKPLFATPQHQLFVSSQLRLKKLLLTASVQQVVNLDTDPSPTTFTRENYTLLKAKATLNFLKNFQVYISGENLLNQAYEINRYYPMPGLTLFAGLNFNI